MKYYVGNFQIISANKHLVTFINSRYEEMPKEMLDKGVIVDALPENTTPPGMIDNGLYYNPETGDLWYEYVDIPQEAPSEMESLRNKVQGLEETIDLILTEVIPSLMG